LTPHALYRLVLVNSQYSEEEIKNLPLPVIREIVYRLMSVHLPIFVLPVLMVTWSRGQNLLFTIYALATSITLVHLIMLVKSNRRLLSPPLLLFICFILYVSTIMLIQKYTIFWSYAFTVGFYLLLEKRLSVIMNIIWVLINGSIAFYLFPFELALIYMLSLATCGFGIEIQSAILYRHEQNLKDLALRDPLTNALNRRAMMQELDKADALHKRYNTSASIIMIDIDHFKAINDNYGHQEGDTVLINFVATLSRRLRSTDSFFRHGGEEFTVLLQSTNLKDAASIADSYCELIRETHLSTKVAITVSCGVAEAKRGESVVNWLNRCDTALYNAKSAGRDCIKLA